MERKVLNICSYREDIINELSEMIRELGRRMKRPLWGEAFESPEKGASVLYLDAGKRGNLTTMARGMSADAVEFIFKDYENSTCHVLLAENFKEEYREGEMFYKRTKEAKNSIAERVKKLDTGAGSREFFAVRESGLEKSPVYSAIKNEAKINVINGIFQEGDISELMEREEFPDFIICDAFSEKGVFAILKKKFGNPLIVHLIGACGHIYAPYLSLEKEVFIETEDFTKQALFAICLWLFDSEEFKCHEKLYNSFVKLNRGEELIKRTMGNFMKINHRRK